MSLSTLQAQLAALNSGKAATGLSFASNKRHAEAAGRGLTHSVQHGHAIVRSTKFKASFVYPTAAAAADVPLSILEQHCKNAFQQLGEMHTPIQDLALALASVLMKRDDDDNNNSNDERSRHEVASAVKQTLTVVSSVLAECDSVTDPLFTASLHVLEYLLRRYEIHLHYKNDLLWALLPVADRFPETMNRCLQLADWTADTQSYLWLRPFCTEPKDGAVIALPPRHLIASNVMKHVDILRTVLSVAHNMATLHEQELPYANDEDGALPRRGIAATLSFTAALVVEGLAWTERGHFEDAAKEAVLRTLLPTISAAIESSQHDNADWTAWGYVVASCAAETMELAGTVVNLLCSKILAAVAAHNQIEAQADAVACVLSILLPHRQGSLSTAKESAAFCYLPLCNNKLLGCSLPAGVFSALCSMSESLPAVLGHLYTDRRMVVAPLVGAFVGAALSEAGAAHGGKNKKGATSATDLIVGLVEQDKLRGLWQDPRTDLTASLAAFVLDACTADIQAGRSVLTALHSLDAAATERGIAYALQNSDHMNVDGEDNDKKTRIAELLDGIVLVNADGKLDGGGAMEMLLPSRVALEHADAAIRFKAVQRLVDSCNVIDGSLLESLLRHATDPNLPVATAVCEALCTWFEQGVVHVKEETAAQAVELVLFAAYHYWSGTEATPLAASLVVVAYMARDVARLGRSDLMESWQRCIEVLGALTASADETVAEQAAGSLLVAFDQVFPKKTKKANSLSAARKLLLKSDPFVKGLQRSETWSRGAVQNAAETALHRSCVVVVLGAMLESLDDDGSKKHKELASDALALCLAVVETCKGSSSSAELTNHDCEVVKMCLLKSLAMLPDASERVSKILIALASTESNRVWATISDPAIKSLVENVRDPQGRLISAFTVLFEAAVRPQNSTVVVKRLLSKARKLASADGCNAPWLAVVPALSLLENSDREVRASAANLLREVGPRLAQASNGRDWSCLKQVCRQISNAKSSAKLGGESFLPGFLATCIGESSDPSNLQEALLTLSVFSALSCGAEYVATPADALENGWLSLKDATGGCRAASILLNAAESSGEEAFPLHVRWKFSGRSLLAAFLAVTTEAGHLPSELANCVGRMLKGVTISDPSVIISTGPRSGRGGRARSYSIGKMDGRAFLTPYPDHMTEALIEVVSKSEVNAGAKMLAAVIARDVFESKTWGEFVFKKLSRSSRKDIASAILGYVGSDAALASESLFADLPLAATDIIDLMGTSASAVDLRHELTLVDFARANADTLSDAPDAPALVALLFSRLALYSASSDIDKDGVDFVIQAILIALGKILERTPGTSQALEVDNKTLESWTEVLLNLLGCGSGPQDRQVVAFRSRSPALSLLVKLCSQFPDRVVASLVPAAMSAVATSGSERPSARNASCTFSKIVPAFMKHAAAGGQSLTNLLDAFVASVATLRQDDKDTMYFELADALSTDRTREPTSADLDACVGALQAFYLANEAHQKPGGTVTSDAIGFAVNLLEHCSESAQMTSLLLLLRYAIGLISQFKEAPDQDVKSKGLLPTPCEIGILAELGSASAKPTQDRQRRALMTASGRKSVRGAIHAILRAFGDGLMLESIRNFIRRGDGEVSSLSLRLWQDLLVIQSVAQMPMSNQDEEDVQFLESVLSLVNESREFLQGILPPHVFLASVSSLVKEGGTIEIRARALRLVADRAVTVYPGSPEALLFVDILPIVLEIFNTEKVARDAAQEDLVLIQSALVSVEHLARALRVSKSDGSDTSKTFGFQYFVSALQHCCRFLLECSVHLDQDSSSGSCLDLASTASLCCATLIRVVGAPCLSVLPKLMKSLIALLSWTNARVSSISDSAQERLVHYRVTQLSVLRALVAVVETVPQFLPPYLPALFTGPAILSESLRRAEKDATVPVAETAELLCTGLSTRVAPRLLVPSASKALAQCTRPADIEVLLSMLKSSTEQASSAGVVAQKNALLNSVTTSFEYECTWEERSPLVLAACDLFDAIVLKLSEVQLRRVYASMREWRGGLDSNDPELLATRRFAFWAVSARLSKGLRSIFLPCLSIVMDDAIAELDLAVATFNRRSLAAKTAEGKKKRKLEDPVYRKESMRALQPLLATLENALRADAYQGGSWIRADENQKYEALLDPLGKLLLSRIPVDFPVPDNVTDTYRYVVEGMDGGSVIGCLTSLAAAGGNEQLWKPLNHAVLQACGDEGRSDVRQAGLLCLVELMKSLGEEYMVLLPENLPILAELLEDSNEEVARLAKEIVVMAEELTGDSLEDSLR